MCPKRKAGLGRGLDDLIGDMGGSESPRPEGELALGVLEPNPYQPRKDFDPRALEALAASIRAQGMLQPIVVRPKPGAPGRYQIIAGERRYRAAELAGLERVPVLVREVADGDALVLALLENLQREDLGPLELAAGLKRMVDDFELTQKELAHALGVSRSRVANSLRLLKLPERVRELLSAGSLSEGHARCLAGVDDTELAVGLAELVVERGLTVRELERMVAGDVRNAVTLEHEPEEAVATTPDAAPEGDDGSAAGETGAVDHDLRLYSEELQRRLGTKVNISPRGDGRGRIIIEYYSAQELAGLYERLTGSETPK